MTENQDFCEKTAEFSKLAICDGSTTDTAFDLRPVAVPPKIRQMPGRTTICFLRIDKLPVELPASL